MKDWAGNQTLMPHLKVFPVVSPIPVYSKALVAESHLYLLRGYFFDPLYPHLQNGYTNARKDDYKDEMR